ncbi:MAG: phosphate ABC transporter substrate-binding protein [Pseudomonadota bacterium]
MKRILSRVAFLAVCWLTALPVQAGVAVVVHPSVNVGALNVDQLGQLFLGRAKTLPDGTPVSPIDLAEGSALRITFSERVLGKNEQQLRSYWSRMIFTGKGQPPRSMATSQDVLRAVAATPGYIGYVDSRDVVAGKVKVVYSLE